MKRIKDQLKLDGEIEEISMGDFREAPGEVLAQVELGKTFVICRNGKKIAVLSKVPGVQLTMRIDHLGKVWYDL